MHTFIIFLRAINVSGKNKVSMPLLKKAFEDNGFTDVVTYINSGNVIFKSDIIDTQTLKKHCEAIIQDTFYLSIVVVVMTIDELTALVSRAPAWWGDDDKEMVHYLMFIIPSLTVTSARSKIGSIKPDYEAITFDKQAIFWSAPRLTFAKSTWSKIASSSINSLVTIRNDRTIKAVIQLANKLDG